MAIKDQAYYGTDGRSGIGTYVPPAAIEVIKPGSRVTIGDNVEAVVCQLSVGMNDCVQYQCVWWKGNDRTQAWLDASEVKPIGGNKLRIGFGREGVA